MNVRLFINMRPRDPEKQNTIRKKSLEMFFKQGLEGFSMQKLARESQVSPATIYIYYKDKEDLILQLCREEMQKTNSATLEGLNADMAFAEGLRIQWLNRARYYLKNPLGAHFLEQMRYTPYYYDEAVKTTGSHFIKIMRSFVQNAIKRGALLELPVEVYWSVAFAPLYQLLKMDLHKRGFPSMKPFRFDEKLMLRTLELVLKALKP